MSQSHNRKLYHEKYARNDPRRYEKEEGFNLYFSGANKQRASEKNKFLREKSMGKKGTTRRGGWSRPKKKEEPEAPQMEMDFDIPSGKRNNKVRSKIAGEGLIMACGRKSRNFLHFFDFSSFLNFSIFE